MIKLEASKTLYNPLSCLSRPCATLSPAQVINSAMAAFILETMAQHGEPSEVLCNKDPLTLKSGKYMADIFPNSKWLFMVRDGRAVIHSVISRKVTISGYKLDNP